VLGQGKNFCFVGRGFQGSSAAGSGSFDSRAGHSAAGNVLATRDWNSWRFGGSEMSESARVSPADALVAVGLSIVRFCVLLIRRRIHQPRQHVGQRLALASGGRARVCRETVVDQHRSEAPAVIVFQYRLRSQRSWVQKVYRPASVLITPFLAGLPGFVSKLWLAFDEDALYGGVYEWDGAKPAEFSAQTIRWILPVVAVPSSIAYQVVSGLNRDRYLTESRGAVSPIGPDLAVDAQ
jgi:hypothetical protein